ncbi:MAG TPA: anhydro-N-acetylmuramic acid kinase [Gemmatimonadaceae bacterium]
MIARGTLVDPHDAAILVGLMSGTSADGITAAVVRLVPGANDAVHAELLAHVTHGYEPAQRERLLAAVEQGTPAGYCRLAFDVGNWLADAALLGLDAAHVDAARVRAIASHGHTIWHQAPHATWQLGEAAVIAERTGIDVVSNFRVRDVAAGGQGAPLVAIADRMLFSAPEAWRALQNLGGIGNVSVVPPRNAQSTVRGFDTGPGCAVIDGVTRALAPELPYDVDGALARAGQPVDMLVDELLGEPFFEQPPPKSTGRELFDRAYIARLIDRCNAAGASTADTVATAVLLTARSIALALRRFVREPVADLVLSGGGARNPALVEAIAAQVAPLAVRRFDELFFSGDAKEAVAFALLGWLHLARRPGNVVSVTGARGPRVLGTLTPA